MANLYQLNEEFKELMALMESDGVDEQVLADTMEGIKGELELKVEGYCSIIKNLSANINALNTEAERMSKRADSLQKNVVWLETALKTYMEQNGLKELKSGVHEAKIVKNGGVQPLWVDEEKVPDTCMKVKYEIDKRLIREKLNAGEVLPFAELKERGTHLSIK